MKFLTAAIESVFHRAKIEGKRLRLRFQVAASKYIYPAMVTNSKNYAIILTCVSQCSSAGRAAHS